MNGIPPHKLVRPANYKAYTENDFWDYVLSNCLREMYAFSQPPADYDELFQLAKEGKEDKENPFYNQHYLSHEEYIAIVEKYLEMFRIESNWEDYSNLMIEYIKNGGYTDVYKKNEDSESVRTIEEVKPISEVIGKEAAEKVLEHMNLCKNFYKLNRDESSFRFTIMNISPTCNAEVVKEYWKSQGIDIEIEERSESDIFALHYEGIMPEELEDYNNELKELENDSI